MTNKIKALMTALLLLGLTFVYDPASGAGYVFINQSSGHGIFLLYPAEGRVEIQGTDGRRLSITWKEFEDLAESHKNPKSIIFNLPRELKPSAKIPKQNF